MRRSLRIVWTLLWLADFRTRELRRRWRRWDVAVSVAAWSRTHRLYRVEHLVFRWFAFKGVLREKWWRFEEWLTKATMPLRPRCVVCGDPEFMMGCARCLMTRTLRQAQLEALRGGRSRTAPGGADG